MTEWIVLPVLCFALGILLFNVIAGLDYESMPRPRWFDRLYWFVSHRGEPYKSHRMRQIIKKERIKHNQYTADLFFRVIEAMEDDENVWDKRG